MLYSAGGPPAICPPTRKEQLRSVLPARLPAVAGHHLAGGLGDQRRGVVDRGHVEQAGAVPADALLQQVDHRLRGRQVAGRLHHQQALSGRAEGEQLAEGGDMVDPGVGPRIGGEHQAVGQVHRDTVGHLESSLFRPSPPSSVKAIADNARRAMDRHCCCTCSSGALTSTRACICSQPPPRRKPRTGQASR